MADLEAKLQEARELQKTPKPDGENPLILIITDGVFSMDGDLADLPTICDLAKKRDRVRGKRSKRPIPRRATKRRALLSDAARRRAHVVVVS